MYDDAYTRNDEGELAVRTVNVTEGSNSSSYDDVFTRDIHGKLALRVTGGGSGDSHNKGYFADLEALEEAYPTGEAGDYAIVGSTDTVWLWDEDTSAWVDSDTKGQVVSVNSKTGTVVLTAEDVGALPQYSTMPVASSSNSGLVVQYTGTTDANYTNGYLYKCVSGFEYMGGLEGNDMLLSVDNQKLTEFLKAHNYSTSSGTTFNLTVEADPDTGDAIYVVENYDADIREEYLDLSVMKTATGIDWTPYPDETPSPTDPNAVGNTSDNTTEFTVGSIYDWQQTNVQPTPVIPDPLPSQTGNAGKFLTTDGTDASWATPVARIQNQSGIVINNVAGNVGSRSVSVGNNALATGGKAIAIGGFVRASGANAIEICGYDGAYDNSDANTFKVGNANGNYEIMSADGTMPADRLTHAINKYSTMPTAASANEGWIVQYTGTTDATYTHGYIYECVSDGGNPATYSWVQVSVQPTPSGLPSQTGQSGKFLTTDGTDASWSDKPLVNLATGSGALAIGSATTQPDSLVVGIGAQISSYRNQVALGSYSQAKAVNATAVGTAAKANDAAAVAIGNLAQVTATNAIQINSSGSAATNSDANTVKIANANGNFEIMSADGTVPTARLTKVNTTATLVVADWSSNTQTVSISGITADGVVFVSPTPASQVDYTSAGVICSAQAAGTLTFTCDTVPSNDISVTVVML